MKTFKAILATLLAVMGFEASAAAVDPSLGQLDKAISTGDRIERDSANRGGGGWI